MNLKVRIFVAVLVVLFPCGCQKSAPSSGNTDSVKRISIVTTLFPLYDFARIICGDKADVRLLLPPGIEAHSFDPKPADLVTISKADVFVFTNAAMEPWATKLLKGVASPVLRVIDASEGTVLLEAEAAGSHEDNRHRNHSRGIDPHLWLDFGNAQIMVDNVAKGIIATDPANQEFYRANVQRYKTELKKLDDDFTRVLANCEKRTFLHGGHFVFGYLATRYGLNYRSAQAINPDAEPTPASIAQLIKLVAETGLKYVYSEELVSPRIAEMLARETGVKILMLHGAHNISRDDLEGGATFVGVMRKNLENLRTGLQCR
jgi:zinc transport system substrate-binding protein